MQRSGLERRDHWIMQLSPAVVAVVVDVVVDVVAGEDRRRS